MKAWWKAVYAFAVARSVERSEEEKQHVQMEVWSKDDSKRPILIDFGWNAAYDGYINEAWNCVLMLYDSTKEHHTIYDRPLAYPLISKNYLLS